VVMVVMVMVVVVVVMVVVVVVVVMVQRRVLAPCQPLGCHRAEMGAGGGCWAGLHRP